MTKLREGRIKRAIREHLAAHPDEAFTTDDLALVCYPAIDPARRIERKYRVAVVRAAEKVLAAGPDWYRTVCSQRGGMVIYANAASLNSVAMADRLRHWGCVDRDFIA